MGLVGLVLLGCDGDPDPTPMPTPGPVSLVEREAWSRVDDVSQDVFGAERPPGEVCDALLGITSELLGSDQVLEINTDLCNYATVQQPSLEPIMAGDEVSIQVWHYDLTAAEPAQAHIALAIDGELAWEQWLPVPAAADLVEAAVPVERDVPAGTDLQFHVHNHGANTYDLVTLEVVHGGTVGEGPG